MTLKITTESALEKTGMIHFCPFFLKIKICTLCNFKTEDYRIRLEMTFDQYEVTNYILVYRQTYIKTIYFLELFWEKQSYVIRSFFTGSSIIFRLFHLKADTIYLFIVLVIDEERPWFFFWTTGFQSFCFLPTTFDFAITFVSQYVTLIFLLQYQTIYALENITLLRHTTCFVRVIALLSCPCVASPS